MVKQSNKGVRRLLLLSIFGVLKQPFLYGNERRTDYHIGLSSMSQTSFSRISKSREK